MTADKSFERCLAFINCQIAPSRQPLRTRVREPRMSITISRETGSGARAIVEELVKTLQKEDAADCPWTVFDRELIERVLEDHHLPARIAKFLPEDAISGINDMVDELLGLHPPSWTVVRQSTETILHLAGLGNVILIGRGATVITAKLENAFHVRFVAPLEERLTRIMKEQSLTRSKAEAYIRSSDQGRARYLKKYFKANIDDPLLYDLVLNTARFSTAESAEMIAQALLRRQNRVG